MIHLLRSELFRMRKRAQSWILIVIAFLLTGLFYGGFTIGAMVSSGQNAADLKEPLPFDQLTDFGLSIALGFFGGVLLVIIAAGMMGNEFSWNTLRPLVARATSRPALISAKLLTLLIYSVVFMLVVAALTALLSIVSSLIAGVDTAFSMSALADAFWFTIRTIVVSMPILTFAFFMATLTRSNAAAIAGALGLSFIEPTVFGLLGQISDTFKTIRKGGIEYNVSNVLVNGLDSRGEWISLGVVLLYTTLFVGLSYWIFLRRDVTSG
ncbi:MAG TPA: ABC transporter permease [Thermomicrobiales bacterium]|nr:ABC transporter permease [Thermomicrobiales bacterium]